MQDYFRPYKTLTLSLIICASFLSGCQTLKVRCQSPVHLRIPEIRKKILDQTHKARAKSELVRTLSADDMIDLEEYIEKLEAINE